MQVNSKKTIFYFQAESGAGKTKYCKELIALLQKIAFKQGQKWDWCVTASTNAFDEYNGQEILFLDDIKGGSLTVSDWLKLLDPFMISPISARYHNKNGSAKVIIMTNTLAPRQFFEQAKENFGEDFGQFVRRFDYLIEIDDKFHLSVATKNILPQNLNDELYFESNQSTFKFQEIGQFDKDEATNRLVKLVMRNMQWNKKRANNASDQTNIDNSISEQK